MNKWRPDNYLLIIWFIGFAIFVIDRKGEIVKRYDKKYMYKVNKPDFVIDETDDTIPGTEIGITELDGIRIGIGICFDLRFPEY